MLSSDNFKTQEMYKNKLDVIDKIIYIAEDTLFGKPTEYDALIFTRKVILRLIKNQKYCLKISIENF